MREIFVRASARVRVWKRATRRLNQKKSEEEVTTRGVWRRVLKRDDGSLERDVVKKCLPPREWRGTARFVAQ
ncbi:MAG: hypothetical protein H7Z38_18290, partial [Rubrivivax sp.]|nr:hypothetical protein [Pyrinomonadaceae bacterium]